MNIAELTHEELVARARALETVLRVSEHASRASTLEELAALFTEAIKEYTRFPSVLVLRYSAEKDGFDILHQRGFDESKFPPRITLPAQGSLTGLAAARGEILTTEDIETDERIPADVRAALNANAYVSGTCIPLFANGELLGSFNLVYPRGATLTSMEREMLAGMAQNLGTAMAQRLAVARELELERQARRAQQLESLGVLAGGIAHDFNNLLMGIFGNVELAQLRASKAEETGVVQEGISELLEVAMRAGERAAGLAKQLLTFSNGGAPILEPTASWGELLRDVALFASRGQRAVIEFDIPQALGTVRIDNGQIAQVIQNLVINACQASPEGAHLRISAARTQQNGQAYVAIQVTDRGPGISSAHLPHVFEPFYSGRADGTGLGLAVSHSIIKRHGGRLSVESSLGEGTTFCIELPCSVEAVAAAAATQPHVRDFSGRALIMDDDEQVRIVGEALLTRLGFQVDSCAHGQDALVLARAAAATSPYKVVLLDLTISGGKGAVEILPELERITPETVRIIVSGYAREWPANVHGSLLKPYRLRDLAQLLKRVLQD